MNLLITGFLIIVFLISPKEALATAPTINNYPSSIMLDNSFVISASMSGLSKSSVYRLRIVLASPGTSNYFGSTFNDASWYNGTPSPIDYSKFLTITTASDGTWMGDVQGKVESLDPNFKTGSGIYDLKLGRYTQTGTTATWSNIKPISLTAPSTPSPTPTPTSSNTPSPSPSQDAIIPTDSPTDESSGPIFSPIATSISVKISDDLINSNSARNSTLSGKKKSFQTPKVEVLGTSENIMSKILIVLGMIFIISSGVIFLITYKRQNG